jgi:nucleotide-binding universal stress UspA family protein
MRPVQRILCGTDLSPASEPAWAEAQLLAQLLGAEIVVLHVVSPLVADRVVRLAPCPVVTVRARPGRPVAVPEDLTRICYATDFSPSARAAWPWVVSLAEAAKAEIDIVYVTPEVAARREFPAAMIGQMAAGFQSHGRHRCSV